jgi:hypothetical protein
MLVVASNSTRAYNAAMRRLLISAFLFLGFAFAAAGQVRVTVSPSEVEFNHKVNAAIHNGGSQPITVCLDIGYSWTDGDIMEATPHPFVIQKESQHGWSILLLGTDVGPSHVTEIIQSGESVKFPFGLRDYGRMRLLLYYWVGSTPNANCDERAKHSRKVKSAPFLMKLALEH